MNLFVAKDFIAHSGQLEKFKIECDALTNDDIETLAMMIHIEFTGMGMEFSEAYGVPSGGNRIAKAFEKYLNKKSNCILVLDDVLTTGRSMKEFVATDLKNSSKEVAGCVIFDRSFGKAPSWVHSLFKM